MGERARAPDRRALYRAVRPTRQASSRAPPARTLPLPLHVWPPLASETDQRSAGLRVRSGRRAARAASWAAAVAEHPVCWCSPLAPPGPGRMSKPPTMERRRSARLERKDGAAPYAKREGSGSGSTGLTSYMEKSKIDFEDDDAAPSRSISMFGKRKPAAAKEKLPPNWKKGKDKAGKVYYFNTVTQQRSHEVPPALPPGWREALHKDSGRVYYYHKESRQSTFEFPQASEGDAAGDDDDAMSEAEPPEPPEGFFGRTISKFTGKGKKKDDGLSRSGTMSRSTTLGRGKKKEEKKEEAKRGSVGEQKTVFISCSTLIKEVKLCVEAAQHGALDALFAKLTNHEIPAELAVRQLMEMVGSTVVQQVGVRWVCQVVSVEGGYVQQ